MWGAELVPAPPWRTNEKSCRRSSVVFCAVEPENAHPCIRRPIRLYLDLQEVFCADPCTVQPDLEQIRFPLLRPSAFPTTNVTVPKAFRTGLLEANLRQELQGLGFTLSIVRRLHHETRRAERVARKGTEGPGTEG